MKVVITSPKFVYPDDSALRMLRDAGLEAVVIEKALGNGSSEEEVYEHVKDADCIIASTERYPASLIARLPNLKIICRRGVGYDAIDVAACHERGITVARTVGAVEGAVAEHVMAYILWFARRLDVSTARMHAHEWRPKMARGAKTRTLGLIGFGGIGKEIAKRAVPFGMKVLYNCRHPNPALEREYGVTYATVSEILAQSDYVSLNVPLTPETHGMIGTEEIAAMKEGAVLINIARGPVVDEEALAAALKSGHLAGAGIDVFPKEPCRESPRMDCPTAVLTPHEATSTDENSALMSEAAARNIIAFVRGNLDPAMTV